MNQAYAAWHVSPQPVPQDTHDQLRYLVRFAVLAPSSHNTQPWRFRVDGEVLELHYAPERRLPVSDPHDRELYLSLGSTLENLACAAESIGKRAKITYKLEGDLAATITLADADTAMDYREAMINRRSTRLPYASEPLDRDFVLALKNLRRGTTQIDVFEDLSEIEALARISGEASGRILGNPAFRKELAGWVRHNWTKQPDGMPGFVQGIPGPVSLLAPIVVGHTNIGPQQAKKDRRLFAASPAIVVLSVEKDVPANWLDGGRAFEAVCLQAELSGYQTSALGSAIEDDKGVQEVKEALHIAGRPVAIIRVGKASKAARHSPRRLAEDVTEP